MVGTQFVVNIDKPTLRELNTNLRNDTLDVYEQPPLPPTSDWP
jgi:hypothetical protein